MVVAISSNPFASTFDGQRGKERVRYEVALHLRGCAKAAEDVPVTRAWIDDGTVRLFSELSGKCECVLQCAWRGKHVRVGDHSQEAAENEVGKAVGLV